jgi:hypothetical protein
MASIITATNSNGLVSSADNSGVLQLASGTGNLVTIPAVTGTAMVSANMPAFSAFSSGNQTISNATVTLITLGSEEFDTNSNFASSRFTPTVAGYYQISSGALFASGNNMDYSQIRLYKNGTSGSLLKISSYYSPATLGKFSEQLNTCDALVSMNGTTDYLEIYAFASSTSTLTIVGGASFYTYMQGVLVRAA